MVTNCSVIQVGLHCPPHRMACESTEVYGWRDGLDNSIDTMYQRADRYAEATVAPRTKNRRKKRKVGRVLNAIERVPTDKKRVFLLKGQI